MKPTHLHIQNYRSLVDCRLPLRDLAVVIGPNGAGKTALLEIFQLLWRGSQQALAEFLENQGGFQAVLSHQHQKETPQFLRLEIDIDVEHEKSNLPMQYQFELRSRQIGYEIGFERLEWQYDPNATQAFRYIDAQHHQLYYADPQISGMTQPTWAYDLLELALAQVPKMYAEPEALRQMFANTQHYSALDVGPRAVVRLPRRSIRPLVQDPTAKISTQPCITCGPRIKMCMTTSSISSVRALPTSKAWNSRWLGPDR